MTSFDENQRLWVVEQISEIEKNLLDNPEKNQGDFLYNGGKWDWLCSVTCTSKQPWQSSEGIKLIASNEKQMNKKNSDTVCRNLRCCPACSVNQGMPWIKIYSSSGHKAVKCGK